LVLRSFGIAKLWYCEALVLRSFGIAKLWYLHLCSSQKDARHGNDHRLTRTAVPLLAYKPLPYLLPLSLPSFGRFRPETFSFYLA